MSTGGCLRRIQPSVPAELRERVLIKGPAYEQPQSHDCQNKHERVLSQKSRPANLSSSNKSIYRKASHTHPQPGQNPFARLPHTTSLPPHPQSNKQSPPYAFFHNLSFGSRLLLTCHSLGALFSLGKEDPLGQHFGPEEKIFQWHRETFTLTATAATSSFRSFGFSAQHRPSCYHA